MPLHAFVKLICCGDQRKGARAAQGARDTVTEPTSDQWRTYFAAERTLLAWVRTALALMGFGFLVERFGLFLRQLAELRGQTLHRGSGSVWLGTVLVLMGTVILIVSARRHMRALNRIAAGTDLAQPSANKASLSLTIGLAFFGIALAAYLLTIR
jgi:putative membrane protein